jgi:crossover junction endodeoxyribonuclease RuvC
MSVIKPLPVTDKIILGIDPGSNVMGYGLILVQSGKPSLMQMGVFDLRKIKDHYLSLQSIYRQTLALIDEYHPDEMALEAPFFGKNVQSMLKLGRAQGVAMAAGLSRDLPITEYAPRKVKMAITGNGQAAKEQVAAMLQRILKISEEEMPQKLDATDALAVAMCHFYESKNIFAGKKYNSWKDFAARNESRIRK